MSKKPKWTDEELKDLLVILGETNARDLLACKVLVEFRPIRRLPAKRIEIVGKDLPKIYTTDKKMERISPDKVAEALGAKKIP